MIRNNRKGFTLPEVLVTVAIVAVLASVVVPSVIASIGKGDKPSVANSIKSTGVALGTFVADMRKYPADPRALFRGFIKPSGTTHDSTTDDNAIRPGHASQFSASRTVGFSASDSARYRGPYLAIASDSMAIALPENFFITQFRHRRTAVAADPAATPAVAAVPAAFDVDVNDCPATVMGWVKKRNADTLAVLDSADINRLEVLSGDVPSTTTAITASEGKRGVVRYTMTGSDAGVINKRSVALCLLPYSTDIR